MEPDWGDNLLTTRDWTTGDTDEAFRAADQVASGRVRSRSGSLASRSSPGEWSRATTPRHGRLDFWESTQNPHPLRTFLAETLGMPESKIHVVQPNVGGGFGLKQPPFQEEPLVAHMSPAARPAGEVDRGAGRELPGHRPLTGTCCSNTRSRSATTGPSPACGRRSSRTSGRRPRCWAGASRSSPATACPGVYRIPNNHIELFVVVTNKCPWNSYRGFGKDSASFLMDRVIEHVVRETGLPGVGGPAAGTLSPLTRSPTASRPGRCWTAVTTSR